MREFATKIGVSIATACAGGAAWMALEPTARTAMHDVVKTGQVGPVAAGEPAPSPALDLALQDLTPDPAARPSFDCAAAAATIERLICSDQGLAEADRALDRIWASLLARDLMTEDLKLAQRNWIAARDACVIAEDPKACVRRHMSERIETLSRL